MIGVPLPAVTAPSAELLFGIPVHIAKPPTNYAPITAAYDWPNEINLLSNVCRDMRDASACVVFFPSPGNTGTCVVYRSRKELKRT
jgi:hypothetical protein